MTSTTSIPENPGALILKTDSRGRVRTPTQKREALQEWVIAPLPECLQELGLAAPGLLAHILVNKFCDHLPLYRQEQIFQQRHGLNLPRQTLARWVELAAD